MSSGFGTKGGRGRCYPFFQEMMACAVQSDAAKEDCKFQIADYNECLTHRKEKARVELIRAEWEKQNPELAKKHGPFLNRVKDAVTDRFSD